MYFKPIALAVLAAPLFASPAQAIPVEWAVADGGNGHYYEFVYNSGIIWSVANAAASNSVYKGMIGYLATITSAEEQAFLNGVKSSEYPSASNFWLGGSDRDSEGVWQWISNPADAWTYTNWTYREPNNANGGEQYLVGWDKGRNTWNDIYPDYDGLRGYVVEYSPLSAVPVPAALTLGLTAMGALGGLGLFRRTRRDTAA
jgi:hypothetical protein